MARSRNAGIEHHAGRIVRAVEQDDARAVGDGGAEVVRIGREVGTSQRHRHVDAAREGDDGTIGVVDGLERDHLVPGVDEGEQRGREGLGGTRGDQHLGVGVDVEAVEPLLVPGDRLAQHGHAESGRVLVEPGGDGVAGGLQDLGRAVLVGEALAEVEGAGARRRAPTSRRRSWDAAVRSRRAAGPRGPRASRADRSRHHAIGQATSAAEVGSQGRLMVRSASRWNLTASERSTTDVRDTVD